MGVPITSMHAAAAASHLARSAADAVRAFWAIARQHCARALESRTTGVSTSADPGRIGTAAGLIGAVGATGGAATAAELDDAGASWSSEPFEQALAPMTSASATSRDAANGS